eukprot:5167375-Alexandrium_andersonii.AAC.1
MQTICEPIAITSPTDGNNGVVLTSATNLPMACGPLPGALVPFLPGFPRMPPSRAGCFQGAACCVQCQNGNGPLFSA